MHKLKTAYFLVGIITGLMLLIIFIWSLPDGKLRVTFCDVGQGDAAYVRFPDGRDMLVDGGPNDKVLECLGDTMPFWDRHINLVVMTHPQKDHLQGLISVFERFGVDYFVRSQVDHTTQGYQKLKDLIKQKHVPEKLVTAGENVSVGSATLTLLWPTEFQISKNASGVLGATSDPNINDYSLVFLLSYGSFDVLFTGDADSRIQANIPYELLADKDIEVLKFPHHGSKTAVTDEFLSLVSPELTVISVGKNSYGHPADSVIHKLIESNSKILRTDQNMTINIISDGNRWKVN